MTPFEIERLEFTPEAVRTWAPHDHRNTNWPVVYVLDDIENGRRRAKGGTFNEVYVGESRNAAARMRQHFNSPQKKNLKSIRVIVDETFNKSVCLDLESYLIRLLAGDGLYRVLNGNDGITQSDYYDRDRYQETFREVFEQLRNDGVFTRSIPEIENSDLFKLSPFKALSQDQAIAVEDILEGLFQDLESGTSSTIVIQGDPGTGKTVVAIYLLKLLMDIATTVPAEDLDRDSLFSEFFAEGRRDEDPAGLDQGQEHAPDLSAGRGTERSTGRRAARAPRRSRSRRQGIEAALPAVVPDAGAGGLGLCRIHSAHSECRSRRRRVATAGP